MIVDVIRERGRLTVAAFMDLALNHPTFGYYARAAQRSGRAGDFFTSVDVGPLFGEVLAEQIEEMSALLDREPTERRQALDVVEAGAANGRLTADVLRALRTRHPGVYARVRAFLAETSPAAREHQSAAFGDVADRIAGSADALPESFEGVLVANELLDALPVHQVVMRHDGLREVFVEADETVSGGLTIVEGFPSTPALQKYLDALNVRLEPGWRAEINLAAIAWIREAAERLRRGFMILIDYGHEAHDLYSASHAHGTLTTYSRHTMSDPGGASPSWLRRPGEQDITAHVDFTSIRTAAEAAGVAALACLDQTYFVLGILQSADEGRRLASLTPRERSALKTLIAPGGLGSTLKVLVLGKDVGWPALRCMSAGMRLT